MSQIMVVGSIAFDSIKTPFGEAPKIPGGSANYSALSASYFTNVQCVSVVGSDYPEKELNLLRARNIDLSGVRIEPGKTFHWTGSYGYDLSDAKTVATALNVFETFEAIVPDNFQKCPFLFLGNLSPIHQMKVLSQMTNLEFVGIDTMNYWIAEYKDDLLKVISKCNALIINESEIRQLTKTHNIVQACHQIEELGPEIVVVKRGEHGATLSYKGDLFALPGLPLLEVKDPTGAGDTFAGGFMGYLASQGKKKIDAKILRKAVVHGCVMASFTVQDFGYHSLFNVTPERIKTRYDKFVALTTFHE